MGFRIRKSIKIAPGIKLNFGKHGFNSVSVGGHGFTKNIGKNGTRTTITPIKGSGISYTNYKPYKDKNKKQDNRKDPNKLKWNEKAAKNIINAELRFNDELPIEMEKIKFFSKAMKVETALTILFFIVGFIQPGFFVFAMLPLIILLFSMIFNKRAKANTKQFNAIKAYKFNKWQECVDYCNESLRLINNKSTRQLRDTAQANIDNGVKAQQLNDMDVRNAIDKANN